ncbi:MBOAT family protein [Ilyomonas limi]|uniref:MBOAT family protein n=1 Tax=Ilyomonas limi TaxID=2575867 RepID=A0A4U3KRH9_9BACT|nr:MBOAT family O-acyltransferase [Ilyomonas limi]TKK64938.1 MBOAT family protein [Ilyomonas limi]
MLFNSFDYLLFLPLVFILYWFVFNKNLTLQNLFLLIASYIFYGWWDWRFLLLLILSTCIDYSFGLVIHRSKNHKKLYLILSIVNNLIILCFFKYYNFFADSAQTLLDTIGFHIEPYILKVALPVGISFYTFHGMSYVFDIYRGNTVPTKKFIDYSVFVCFFPLLVAGPIERATHLLPQVQQKRTFSFEKGKEGIKQILWGLFKKIVIADTCAKFVNEIFDNYHAMPSSMLVLGAVYFAFQIYGDFSGYSDIALGSARLLGFELLINFRYPYFSRDIAEFWRRWHISLSSWFRDYLYFPLGGSRGTLMQTVRNTFIIFLVSGFWHGANWTYIIWGFLHALYFMPLLLAKKNRTHLDTVGRIPKVSDVIRILVTFILVTFAWIFFRAPTVSDAFEYISCMFSFKAGGIPVYYFSILPFILLMFIIDWLGKMYDYPLRMNHTAKPIRYALYFILTYSVISHITNTPNTFIYFQF